MHNSQLWENILAYDLDDNSSEYGFLLRLANENYWTKAFTLRAIEEYKKFMYLAATSDFMVSPSEIIDIVWHQHLIFTQSYQQFCDILGKQVQHIPSTHNKEDFKKFKRAKDRTIEEYKENFGETPVDIWQFNSMFDSLNLAKAKFKIRAVLVFSILTVVLISIPAYYFLKPLYLSINNPDFIYGYLAIILCGFLTLEIFNRKKLKSITTKFDKSSFIYNLDAYELVYLKTQRIENVVNGVINELVEDGTISVNEDYKINLAKKINLSTIEKRQAVETLKETDSINYAYLVRALVIKPAFFNIPNAMNAFKKYFNKSKHFAQLFYINFIVLALIIIIGFTRVITGVSREKPIVQVSLVVILLAVAIIIYLKRLTGLFCAKTIPEIYKTAIIPGRSLSNDWQWQYFLMGSGVMAASFLPVIKHSNKKYLGANGGDASSGCGSSCGSSCSSCGGCGGD